MSTTPPDAGPRQLPALFHPRSISLDTAMVAEMDEMAHERRSNRSALIREAWACYVAHLAKEALQP